MRIDKIFLIGLAGVAAIMLGACSSTDTDRASKAAEVILTSTSGDASTAAETPTGTSAESASATAQTPQSTHAIVTATPSLFFARCLAHEATQMHREPSADAVVVVDIKARDIFTAYGRTLDAKWVLGWVGAQDFGWTDASNVGCTAPITELKPAEPNALLLTPVATAVAIAQAETPTPPASATAAIATQTLTPVAPTAAPTVVPTTVDTMTASPAPSETSAPEPSVTTTPIPPTTVPPTAVPPTLVSVSTSTPAIPAATLPAAQPEVRVITIVVTVLVTPSPAVVPTEAPTPTSPPATAMPATTQAASATEVAVTALSCEVTPGTPVNFRRGPSRLAKQIGVLRQGTPFIAQGRIEDGSWLFGVGPRNTPGWLIVTAVQCSGDVTQLPVVDR